MIGEYSIDRFYLEALLAVSIDNNIMVNYFSANAVIRRPVSQQPSPLFLSYIHRPARLFAPAALKDKGLTQSFTTPFFVDVSKCFGKNAIAVGRGSGVVGVVDEEEEVVVVVAVVGVCTPGVAVTVEVFEDEGDVEYKLLISTGCTTAISLRDGAGWYRCECVRP